MRSAHVLQSECNCIYSINISRQSEHSMPDINRYEHQHDRPIYVCSHFELDPWSGSEWKVADCGEVQWLQWTMITIPTITLSAGGRAQLTFTPCKVIPSVRLDHRLKDQTKTKARWHQHNFYSLTERDFFHQVKKQPSNVKAICEIEQNLPFLCRPSWLPLT